ncbi:hypothetical protein Tco_1428316 [Tanacetum coccineum]
MEQISAAFLTEECSAILQNKIPPKLGDLESFLIPYKLANSVKYLALANLGAISMELLGICSSKLDNSWSGSL